MTTRDQVDIRSADGPWVQAADRDARLAEISRPGWTEEVRRLIHRLPTTHDIDGDDAQQGRATEHLTAVHDPSTGQLLTHVPNAGRQQVDAAVRTAERAQPAWAELEMAARIEAIQHLAALVDANASLLATVDALDAGLPVGPMLGDIANAVRISREWCGLAGSVRGEVLQNVAGLHYTRRAPYGVVARIVAYNHPLFFAVRGSVPALLAGNTVVLKPAEQTPLSALVLVELIARCLPPGVLNIVTGGADCGQALVRHPSVRRIAFTGSVPTGLAIQRAAAEDQVRKVTLELGGKNAMIVFPDADVETVVAHVIQGMNLTSNQGQSCGSTSRLFVHEAVHQQVLDGLTDALARLRLGPAYEPGNDMGPLVSQRIAERVRGYIRAGTDEGATLVTGGLDDPRLPEEGYYVAPTLFADVPADARIAREEIFGPVISLFSWRDREEVIAAANAVDYGLTASVWTESLTEGLDTAHRLQAGYVWLNDTARHYFGTPFGGWKDSGVGSEESVEELLGFTQVQSVHVKVG